MNNVFNTRRFGLLLRKTVLERPMQMFGFTGLILAFVLILYAVCKPLIGFHAAQNITFIWGLGGGACFLSSFVFGYFSSNANGSSYLTLPASHFEKWLCGILIAGLLYPLIFLVFYRIMDASFVGIYHSGLDPAGPFYKDQYESVYVLPFDGVFSGKVYDQGLIFSGAMLIGSLYFNKVNFIKVALVICVLCIGAFALNWLIAKAVFGNISNAFPFHYVMLSVGKEIASIELPGWASNIYNYIIEYLIPALLWGLAFIRLREKEF